MGQIRSPLRIYLLCSLLIVVSICLFWWKVTLLGLTPSIKDPGHMYEDFFSMIPAWKLIFTMIRSGHFPLWSPYSQAGMLLLADQHYTIAYPPIWANLFFNPQISFSLIILLHLFISSVSLYFLMSRLGASPPAALCAAFIYVFSFPVTYGFLLYGAMWAWHWLPLILLLTVLYLDKGKRVHCLLLAVVWYMQMCTFIQSSYNLSILFAAFTIFYGVTVSRRRTGWLRLWVRFGAISIAIVLGSCLAAIHLIPLFEFSTLWKYRQFSYEEAAFLSLHPRSILESLLSVKKHQYGSWVLVSFMGTVGVIFSLFAVIRSPKNKAVLFFAPAFVIACLLALGKHTPLYQIFYCCFPGASFFHHPTRFLMAVPICLSIVAGFGIQRLIISRREGGKRANLLLIAALFFLFTVACAGKRFDIKGLSSVPLALSTLQDLSVYSLAVLAIAFIFLRGHIKKGWLAFGLLCLIFVESYSNTGELEYFDAGKKYSTPRTVRFLRKNAGLDRFITYNKQVYHYPPRFMDDDSVPLVYPELSNYFQVYDIQVRGPLQIRRYADLIKAINKDYEFVLEAIHYTPRIRDFTSGIIDLFGVKYIVSKGKLEVPEKMLYDTYWETTVKKGKPAIIPVQKRVKTGRVLLKSYLEMASEIGQGQEVALASFWSGDEKVAERPLLAGIHTAEVFRLNDPLRKESVRHSKADEWESWEEWTGEGKKMTGSFYRTTLDLEPAVEFDRIEIRYVHNEGLLRFTRIYFEPEDREHAAREIKRRFLPVFEDEAHDIIIYENEDVLPRAFLVGNIEVAKRAEDALEMLLDGGLNLFETIIIEEEPPASFSHREKKNTPPGEVEIIRYSPNRIEMRAMAKEGCFLFISDVYYPGWETTIDGVKTKTYRADYAFRAAYVPAGKHEVVMRFRPRSFMIGGLISSVSLAVILAGLAVELTWVCRRRD